MLAFGTRVIYSECEPKKVTIRRFEILALDGLKMGAEH